MSEGALQHRQEEIGFRVQRYVYPPGTAFPEHTHAEDKIDAVLAGCLRLEPMGTRVKLQPGQWIEIPAGTSHTVAVMGDMAVVCLDRKEARTLCERKHPACSRPFAQIPPSAFAFASFLPGGKLLSFQCVRLRSHPFDPRHARMPRPRRHEPLL